jgi:hypothetical protein
MNLLSKGQLWRHFPDDALLLASFSGLQNRIFGQSVNLWLPRAQSR